MARDSKIISLNRDVVVNKLPIYDLKAKQLKNDYIEMWLIIIIYFYPSAINKINKSLQHDVPVLYVFYCNGQMNHKCNNKNTTSCHSTV